jgi:hypothetical protein
MNISIDHSCDLQLELQSSMPHTAAYFGGTHAVFP